MKRGKLRAPAAAVMWFLLMGCATPEDRGKPRQQLVDEAMEAMDEMSSWPDISIKEMKEELGFIYIRSPSRGVCPKDRFIHGPQDKCHPHHEMYDQISRLVAKLRMGDTQKISDHEAERLALSAFFCARLNKLERVDEIESWPIGAPWASRLLTLHQHPGEGPSGRRAGAVDTAAIAGLKGKHNQLILMVRMTDGGMTYDSGNIWQ
jgi:hypothetical protein